MRSLTALKAIFFLTAICLFASTNSGYCDDDDLFDDQFRALHPQSIGVAFAIHDAIEAGLVERTMIALVVADGPERQQSRMRLESLKERLTAAAESSAARMPITVVLIDSGLWAHFTPNAHGYALSIDDQGAQSGERVVITSEGVILAVLSGKLSIDAALTQGVIAIEGHSVEAGDVRRLIASAFGAR